MQYDLLLTNTTRVRWLWWSMLAYVVGGVLLSVMGFLVPFGLVIGLPIALVLVLIFYDKLIRQPGWVQVSPEGIAWVKAADNPPASWKFEEIRAYRFEFYRNGIRLFLYLQDGQEETLDASFTLEYGAMQRAFEQAVKRYNQTHLDTRIVVEKDGLEKFFQQSSSTSVLIGLLVVAAAWITRCLSQGASGLAYLPLLLLLPYLAIWANFYYQRP